MSRPFRYPWPSSQLTPADMRLLHTARESHPEHPPITVLIAQAVRAIYKQSTQKETHETVDTPFRAEGRAVRPVQGRQPTRTGTDLGQRAA